MKQAEQQTLWGGRFTQSLDEGMARFNNVAGRTAWLLEADILGSIAHGEMLGKCGLITPEDAQAIHQGLKDLLAAARRGELTPDDRYEDVHTFVELELTRRIGEPGKLLHTARSRNDQVNLDMLLYTRQSCREVLRLLEGLVSALAEAVPSHPQLMPGYTHLQRAQAITVKHWLMAYGDMFKRDIRRLEDALTGMDQSPLGAGALAGTTHPIDRAYTAKALGFSKPYANFLDAVSDRDYLLETLGAFSLLMMHLSRLSEEIINFSTREFGFITLHQRFSTGSSIMPQKQNPDSVELIRGKTGRVYGSLMTLLTVMKGLPLAYNKDMQEDKECFHDAVETVKDCLTVMTGVISSMASNTQAMDAALETGFLNATELADYLVRRGLPFRDAHHVVGRVVLYAEERQKEIQQLTLKELRQFSPLFEEAVYEQIDYQRSLKLGIKKEML